MERDVIERKFIWHTDEQSVGLSEQMKPRMREEGTDQTLTWAHLAYTLTLSL